MDLQGHYFSDPRDPMINFSDCRDRNRVSETP